jgi:hypothetical protein
MEIGDFPFLVGFTNKPFVGSGAGIAVGISDIIDKTFVCDDVLRELEVGNFIGEDILHSQEKKAGKCQNGQGDGVTGSVHKNRLLEKQLMNTRRWMFRGP